MGIASFVVGITCLVLSPFLSVLLILPSILGLILGIVDTVIKSKKKQPKGLSIAGIVLSTIALVICILIVVAAVTIYTNASETILSNTSSTLEDLLPLNQTRNVGESATLDDIKVTLVSVDTDFEDYYSYAFVDEDCNILQANFEFENVGDYSEYVSYSNFKCFADKFSCDSFYSVEGSYFYETIEEGKKARGTVYFEIPKDADSIEIEYDGNSYDNSKITFIVEDNK